MTYIELTKWPRLLVQGDPVTEEQANEILIRTNYWHYQNTNDKAWDQMVDFAVGIPPEDYSCSTPVDERLAQLKRREQWMERMGVLDLGYLNNSRIGSAWIFGVHGWCDWDGKIGCANYNIGKWPEISEVQEEWDLIAAAFPYLHLRAQLVPDEGAAPRPAVEWRIKDGKAEINEPAGFLTPAEDGELEAIAKGIRIGELRSERATVTIDRIAAAAQQVKASLDT